MSIIYSGSKMCYCNPITYTINPSALSFLSFYLWIGKKGSIWFFQKSIYSG